MIKNIFKSTIFIGIMLFYGCSSKNIQTTEQIMPTNPLGTAFGDPNDPDPLKLGKTPTPLSDSFDNPQPLKLPRKLPEFEKPIQNSLTKDRPLLSASNSDAANANFPNLDNVSDYLTIMAPNGITISVWSSTPGNWLWGYALYNSDDLGGYRVWRLIILPNNEVMIINGRTRTTCINTYNNGLIDATCDVTNPAQRFKLRPMTNGAVQIYNPKANMCVQTPIDDFSGFDLFGPINFGKCTDTIDEQWYLVAPPIDSRLLY
ncbi:cytolethal distending toxin, subunit CdtA [Campylobacter mucosalis]|uniref:cytolethal distending toxin subunit A n=1 Tax=Campylobacter mucosalis TaxID=202 RepID=UPI001597CEDB|nr:cytolethal distending toxin subunit A [Campylobacter mucosalis]QKF62418.1 cytolethal distending toxin, subunit CdtA [Campylobacter mucosalis]